MTGLLVPSFLLATLCQALLGPPLQGSMRGRSRVARSASQRSNGPRPAHPPPPRPPAPPDGSLYDDCATALEFAGTPLAFVHDGRDSAQQPAVLSRPLPARPTAAGARPPTGVAALAQKFEKNATEAPRAVHGRLQPNTGQRSYTTLSLASQWCTSLCLACGCG